MLWHFAVTNNDLLTTVGLLNFVLDPNFGNINGNTSLHIGRDQGIQIAQALLAFGVHTDTINARNHKPMELGKSLNEKKFSSKLRGSLPSTQEQAE
jgi:ankyrin repeat protein